MTEELIMTEEINEEVVEQPVEPVTEQPKTYTEDEFNAKLDEVLGKKIARKEAKIRKEYENKYGRLEQVLKAGTGSESVEQLTDTFQSFYEKKGITIPDKPSYSDRDVEVLAKAEAEDIIRAGYDEVVDEVDRLAALGAANMTTRERMVFTALAEYRQTAERGRELSALGVTEDVYNSPEFAAFAGKFNPTTPIADVYNIYTQMQPKNTVERIGSMKNGSRDDGKKYYTPEEVDKLTAKDFDDPNIFAAVRASMQKWGK